MVYEVRVIKTLEFVKASPTKILLDIRLRPSLWYWQQYRRKFTVRWDKHTTIVILLKATVGAGVGSKRSRRVPRTLFVFFFLSHGRNLSHAFIVFSNNNNNNILLCVRILLCYIIIVDDGLRLRRRRRVPYARAHPPLFTAAAAQQFHCRERKKE